MVKVVRQIISVIIGWQAGKTTVFVAVALRAICSLILFPKNNRDQYEQKD